MKRIESLLIVIAIILVVGCNKTEKVNEDIKWFHTKEKAIEYGLQPEAHKFNSATALSTVDYKGGDNSIL
ncbi:hypothetical protein [Alkalihalobacillus sp. AL-G]|uniref:hypothetical protein n=1 Tax=Alkalihalobacillus sp. AL-G TaxID=2926399 RepID=UPI00272B2AA5|nr:hypothetical protein [Alkalihalobacillus sp. AL-G]WLD94386.1 hypothetical protein MOJ78_05730 [Alkalihalobacillus sp. AL-G]